MDNFRVFEPIVSFSAEAHARSLSWIIYNDLRESGNPLYGSAGCDLDADDHWCRDPADTGADPHLARLQPQSTLRRRSWQPQLKPA